MPSRCDSATGPARGFAHRRRHQEREKTMTTLPHTAPIRLPRQTGGQLPSPNGNGHVTALAHAQHPVFAVPHAGAGGAQLTPSDVWRVIRSNLWLIILSLLVSAGAGVAVNQYILKPYY